MSKDLAGTPERHVNAHRDTRSTALLSFFSNAAIKLVQSLQLALANFEWRSVSIRSSGVAAVVCPRWRARAHVTRDMSFAVDRSMPLGHSATANEATPRAQPYVLYISDA